MSIRLRYIIALLIIATMVSISALTVKYLLSTQRQDAEIINRAGQQRMLSQRISLLVNRLALCNEQSEVLSEKLSEAILRFEDNHGFLTLKTPLSDEVKRHYYGDIGLDTMTLHYLDSASAYLSNPQCGHIPEVFLSTYSDYLLTQLNEAVSLFEREAQQHVEQVDRIETYLWIITLLVLLADGLFIFMPLEKKIAQQIEALSVSNQQAQAANRAKSEFLASMSHELRTPMNGLFGMIDLAMDNQAKSSHYLAQAKAAGRQLLSLINDILDLSKIEANKLQISEEQVNLLQLIDDMVVMYSINCAAKHIDFHYEKHASIPPCIVSDAKRISQILHNLLSNAVKFTHQGSVTLRVEMEHGEQQNWVKFSVIDTGIGIPEGRLDCVFNKFEQVDQSTTRIYGGTGLGLSIAHQLCALMHGQIGVESKEGQGSQFFFKLPAIICPRSHHKPLPNVTLKCAIVDDLASSREYLAYVLHNLGAVTEEFASARDFIESTAFFDVVLIDLSMPEIDGIELLHHIQARTTQPTPYVIVVSAVLEILNGNHELLKMVWRTHAKPVDRARLEADIRLLQQQGIHDVDMADTTIAGMKVLVAEDNAINSTVVQHMLEQHGCSVTLVADGQQVINALNTTHFDLVLMDVQMPHLDGLQATEIIRKEVNPTVPIIALTANAFAEDRQRCLESGMNDFLSKPIDKDTLINMLYRYANV